jgi:hypothetical protein
MATGLVPAKRVLAFLDPVLNIASAIVDFDYLGAWNVAFQRKVDRFWGENRRRF